LGYSEGYRIIDSNSNFECAIVSGGQSGASAPTWKTALGAITLDASEEWRNVGPAPNYALPVAGGVIMDNTVGSGTLADASQLYFSTRGTGGCGAGNGCAVQASQAALN